MSAFKTIEIDNDLLIALLKKTVGKIPYKLGAKAALGADSSTIHEIDCSGLSRWLLNRISKPPFTLVDGSQNQWHQVREAGFEEVAYSEVTKRPGVLFIAFMGIQPDGSGHVWFVKNGLTIESCGGKGVSRQVWSVYKSRVGGCYALTEPMS